MICGSNSGTSYASTYSFSILMPTVHISGPSEQGFAEPLPFTRLQRYTNTFHAFTCLDDRPAGPPHITRHGTQLLEKHAVSGTGLDESCDTDVRLACCGDNAAMPCKANLAL